MDSEQPTMDSDQPTTDSDQPTMESNTIDPVLLAHIDAMYATSLVGDEDLSDEDDDKRRPARQEDYEYDYGEVREEDLPDFIDNPDEDMEYVDSVSSSSRKLIVIHHKPQESESGPEPKHESKPEGMPEPKPKTESKSEAKPKPEPERETDSD